MAEVAEMVKCVKFASSLNPAEYEARKAREDEEALTYLRVKFPGVDEETFFTDYRGNVSKHVQDRSGNQSVKNRAYMFTV